MSSVTEAIEAIARGEIVIVTDDGDRENEGDLICAASLCTPEKMAFIIRNCSGIVCAPVTAADARRLNLQPMVAANDAPHATAFTVSVDVKHGLTTGISAEQRSNTVRGLANGIMGPADFVRPGHVFPLIAREGGVLMRSGHTEAAVDLCRLAGLPPVGVICELANDDGTVMAGPQIEAFAANHGLKRISVAELIAHRQAREKIVERVNTFQVMGTSGPLTGYAYVTPYDPVRHFAFVQGDIGDGRDIPTRLHRIDIIADVIAGGDSIRKTFAAFKKNGRGVFIFFLRDGTAAEEKLQKKEAGPQAATGEAPAIVHEVLSSPGQPLDAATRAFFEPRFGHDFSGVRVHPGTAAEQSAREVNANAYTVGRDMVFGAGRFAPWTHDGRWLLAHELAHAIQQQGSVNSTGAMLKIGDPVDRAEREAGAAACAVLATGRAPHQAAASRQDLSPAIRPDPHRVLRRAPTWAGELYTDRYDETYDVAGKRVRPGVIIQISFKPNEQIVNAEKIGFVQTAKAFLNGEPYALTPEIEKRMIPKPDLGAGTHIDSTGRTPLGAMKDPAQSDELSASQESSYATFGYHFKDEHHEYTTDATMVDPPGFEIGEKDDAEMTFETAAVAVDGVQKGAYYGSASWGWTRKPSQRPKKLPFAPASTYSPGQDFLEAARLWNISKTSQGEATIHLPSVAVKYTTKKTKLVDDPAKPGKKGAVELAINTAVEVTERTDPAHKAWQNVIVASGADAGKTGWVSEPLSDTPMPIMPPKKTGHQK